MSLLKCGKSLQFKVEESCCATILQYLKSINGYQTNPRQLPRKQRANLAPALCEREEMGIFRSRYKQIHNNSELASCTFCTYIKPVVSSTHKLVLSALPTTWGSSAALTNSAFLAVRVGWKVPYTYSHTPYLGLARNVKFSKNHKDMLKFDWEWLLPYGFSQNIFWGGVDCKGECEQCQS